MHITLTTHKWMARSVPHAICAVHMQQSGVWA
jgi:hypothetical protein